MGRITRRLIALQDERLLVLASVRDDLDCDLGHRVGVYFIEPADVLLRERQARAIATGAVGV